MLVDKDLKHEVINGCYLPNRRVFFRCAFRVTTAFYQTTQTPLHQDCAPKKQ